jgi:hypothetical protein
MKTLILVYLGIYPFFAIAQNPNKLTFEVGYGINNFSMKNFNEFYIDSFAIKNNLLDIGISSGNHFFIGLSYKPHNLFDLGFYGNYQYAETKGEPEQFITDEFGIVLGINKFNFIVRTESIGVGVTNCWYISHLLKFYKKENRLLQHFNIGIEINAGIGFSKATLDLKNLENSFASSNENYTSKDFQGQIALKFEYDYCLSPIVSSLGIKGGFQCFNTKTLHDRIGNEWMVIQKHPINLNYSGFFGAVYLTIGK